MNGSESALNLMRDELRTLHEDSGDGVLLVDLRGERFASVNGLLCRMLQYSESEMLSLGVRDVHPKESLPRVLEQFEAMRQKRFSSASDVPFLRKDGAVVRASVTMVHVTYEKRPHMLGLVRDITDQKRVVAALRESEATLRGLFEQLSDLVLLLDRDGKIQCVNRDWPGAGRQAVVGELVSDRLMPDCQPAFRQALDQARATGMPQTVAAQDQHEQRWSYRIVPVGDLGRVIVIGENMTSEKVSAEAVKKEQRLLRQTLELQERERRLVACEIHDRFAQPITGALFRLQAFRETHARSSAQAWQDFDAAGRMLATAIDEARRLISGLRPLILDELGIVEAIEYLCCERRLENGPEIEFVHAMTCQQLEMPLQTAVFRIAQESVANACRHSHSPRVRIELRDGDGWIHLAVRDWGVGFRMDSVAKDRFGLQTIRERVRLLDGRVAIESSPNEGTSISVDLPLAGSNGGTQDAAGDNPCSKDHPS
ncbi:MAG: PAS domain S-box protein [Planctomycetaceae bacterium]|nr:PAS domain S-box protein [Planctomycetaceae bacterium]